MTTKPSYIDRFSMIGDTIPMTKPPGAPGAGNRVYVGMNDTPLYSAGTRFHGFEEATDSGSQNRPHWALAECISAVYEQEIAKPHSIGAATSGTGTPVSTITPTGQVMYLGETGAVVGDLAKVTDMLDGNWDELADDSTPPVKIVTTALDVQDPNTLGWFSVYPGGGLPADTTSQTISQVGVPNNNSIDFSGGLVGSAVGVSLINYDQWLRGLKSGVQSEIDAAFATITIDRNPGFNNQFDLHRNVATFPVAEQWQANDTVFISHFCYEPRVTVNPAIPDPVGSPTSYRLVMGIHSTLGRLPTDALTSLKVRTAEEVPYELETYILGGLDAAYDQLGFGSPGGGRFITVDSGPVTGYVAADGGAGFIAYADSSTGPYSGTMDFVAGIYDDSVYDEQAGFVSVVTFPFNDVTEWDPGDSCTGAGSVVTITAPGKQFANAAGNTNIFERLDLIMLLDGSGNPVINPGSPDGTYIINNVTGQFTVAVTCMDGSAPLDITTAAVCRPIRPVFAGFSGRIGDSAHKSNIFSSIGPNPLEPCIELDGYYDHSGLGGRFVESYIGNKDRSTPIATETFRRWGGGPDFSPLRYLGIIGATYNNDQIWSETIEKSGAAEAKLMYQWEEATLGGCHFHMQAEELGTPLTASARYEVHPLAVGSGVYDGTNYAIAGLYLGQMPGDSSGLFADIWDSADVGDRARTQLALYEASHGRTTWLALIEDPDLSGSTEKKEPVVVTSGNANVDRLELEELTNYGFSDWQQMWKTLQSPLWYGFGGWGGAWSGADLYWHHPGSVSEMLFIPILLPHGARLDQVELQITGLDVGGNPIKVYLKEISYAGGDTDLDKDLTVNPGGGTATVTLSDGSQVDIETYKYLVMVESSVTAVTQAVKRAKVQFSWIDILPE